MPFTQLFFLFLAIPMAESAASNTSHSVRANVQRKKISLDAAGWPSWKLHERTITGEPRKVNGANSIAKIVKV